MIEKKNEKPFDGKIWQNENEYERTMKKLRKTTKKEALISLSGNRLSNSTWINSWERSKAAIFKNEKPRVDFKKTSKAEG